MVQVKSIALFGLVAATARAIPVVLEKRIAQVIVESTADWEKACVAAGGASQCNPLSQKGFMSLLANAGACDQQNAADEMVSLAKTLNNNQDMIRLSQLFVQQPRNSPNSVSIPYCQQAPRNSELNGLFQCQFAGSKKDVFANGAQGGNIPFGLNAGPNPAGSCPANPNGPIADGVQLNTITKNPNAPGGGAANTGGNTGASNGNTGNTGSTTGNTGSTSSNTGSNTGGNTGDNTGSNTGSNNGGNNKGNTGAQTTTSATPAKTSSTGSTGSGSTSASGGFKKANGEAAQALNAKFASLTPDSACTAGENACVNGAFAQCSNGKFVMTQCAGGLICTALPLVNSPGTSVTCDTAADRDARIATALGSA